MRRNILATQQLLAFLPESGVSLLLLSSHLAAERHGVVGSTLAAAEALVAQWAVTHPSCPVQVWHLPSAAWLSERMAEALVD